MKHILVLALLGFCLSAFGGTLESKNYFRYLDSSNIAKNDISLADSMGETPLHRAAAANDSDAFFSLAEDGAQFVQDLDGQSPLAYAILENHLELAAKMIEFGASIYETDVFGRTIRDLAEEVLTDDRAAHMIGVFNLKTNFANKYPSFEETFIKVAESGDYYAIKALIEWYNAPADFVDPKTGNNLTHFAASAPNGAELIQYLSRKSGMDNLASLNNKRQTPLFIAIQKGYRQLYPVLLGKEFVALFIHGEHEGKLLTPYELVYAIHGNDEREEFKQILNYVGNQEDLNVTFRAIAQLELAGQPKKGMLEVLNFAASYEDFRLLQYFIDAGTSFTEGYRGDLPLNVAIKSKTYIVVNFMIKMGISPDITDGSGVSARELAQELNDPMINDILAGKYL